MALGFYFTPTGFKKDQYDEVIRRLDAAGAGTPAGRSYHVAMEADGAIGGAANLAQSRDESEDSAGCSAILAV